MLNTGAVTGTKHDEPAAAQTVTLTQKGYSPLSQRIPADSKGSIPSESDALAGSAPCELVQKGVPPVREPNLNEKRSHRGRFLILDPMATVDELPAYRVSFWQCACARLVAHIPLKGMGLGFLSQPHLMDSINGSQSV